MCEDRYEIINANQDRRHERSWDFSSAGSFCTTYESMEQASLASGDFRNAISPRDYEYEKFWGAVYRELVSSNKSKLNFLVDSLQNLAAESDLSQTDLSQLVVSFVQDIPYSYVLARECSAEETAKHPCLGNERLGILSPYEFIHSLYGDCDTRAVLIYTILEELGFDPMIVISKEYSHAMLAINMPAIGDHLTFNGKNYYFWETTGKGWPVGVLPPSSKNVNYWKIALVNEL